MYLRGKYSSKHRISRKKVPVVTYMTDRINPKATQRVNSITREKRASKLHEFANSYTVPWTTDPYQVRNLLHMWLAPRKPIGQAVIC